MSYEVNNKLACLKAIEQEEVGAIVRELAVILARLGANSKEAAYAAIEEMADVDGGSKDAGIGRPSMSA
ncbi:hypothetical protein N8I74_10965 [Chitiniphilus purpureus]|uniref:Uncharacterized protein n=1 Tax=Chitiniphilus purpureus TaxID=2981137 RepID=A0ABY6DPK7_9NEIS|nr:hypothetical protein [Chitiniphilus sp. CD1]UXY13843.1 hypothetical protein N8I74_10965 [Chitiniphilus sp. CD1]